MNERHATDETREKKNIVRCQIRIKITQNHTHTRFQNHLQQGDESPIGIEGKGWDLVEYKKRTVDTLRYVYFSC